MMARRLLIGIAGLVLMTGCEKNPIERLVNPYNDASVPGVSGSFFIYDDELKTGSAVAFIPFGENQNLDVADKTSPRRSTNHLRYVWTGADTSSSTPGAFQHEFAGFSLLTSPSIETSASAPGRNLAAAGYTSLKFWIRGSLSLGNRVRVEGPDDGDPRTPLPALVEFAADQLADWQEVTMAIPAADFEAMKTFMTVSIQYAQPPRTTPAGAGGTVYLDDVRYE